MGLLTYVAAMAALAPSQAVAEQAWGIGPCTGQTTVQIVSQAELKFLRDGLDAHTPRADADENTCHIRMSWDGVNTQSDFCTDMVHEYGHLRRLRFGDSLHSPDRRHVMYTHGPTTPIPKCIAQFPPPGVNHLRKKEWKCKVVNHEWKCKKVGRWYTSIRYFDYI